MFTVFFINQLYSQNSWFKTYKDSCRIWSIFPSGNSIIGIGDYLDNITPPSNYYYIRTNLNGDTLAQMLIADTFDIGHQIGLDGLATFDNKITLAGFAQVGISFELRMIQLDTLGNILWRQTYPNTDGNGTGVKMLTTPDSGYALFGEASYSGYFIKTDKFGNQQFRQNYGYNFMYIWDAIYNPNNTYTMVGYKDNFNATFSAFIMNVDSAGYINWSQTYSNNSYYLFFALCKSQNSYYVSTKIGNNAYISKISNNGMIQGLFNLNKTGGLSTIKLDLDNNIFGCGTVVQSNSDSAYFVKLDTTGAKIFEIAWGSSHNDDANSCYQDIDSDYIVASNFDNKSFIAKIDSAGQITYINQLSDHIPNINIYPNPSKSGSYNLKCNDEVLKISITDLSGKEVNHSDEISSGYEGSFYLIANPGLYFLTIYFKSGSKETIRLFKH